MIETKETETLNEWMRNKAGPLCNTICLLKELDNENINFKTKEDIIQLLIRSIPALEDLQRRLIF